MKKVLVLEDESSIRSFIVINLRRAGYDVIEAETGEEALEQLKAACQHNNEDYLDLMLHLVPTYHPENSAACVVELHREDKKEL